MALLRIGNEQAADLALVRSLSDDQLHGVVDRLSLVPEPLISASAMLELIRQAISDPTSSRALARLLITLCEQQRVLQSTADQIFDDLISGLAKRDDWTEDEVATLRQQKRFVVAAIETETAKAAGNALALSYEAENIFHRARIITDFRPVFHTDRESVLGGIIMQMLKIEYTNESRSSTVLYLALDKDDVVLLREMCEKALIKADALEGLLKKSAMQTFHSGEEKYGLT